MKWFANFRNVKYILIAIAAVIAAASLLVSNSLVKDLKAEEEKKMEIWAEAMNSLNRADANTDLALVLTVLNGNTTIPVVVTDSNGAISLHRNIEFSAGADSLAVLMQMVADMRLRDQKIRVDLGTEEGSDYLEVCYSDSLILKQLAYYPYVQLAVVLLFFAICFVAILSSKRAEQNRVWVGLSKETAHQLGTPISSLMAWTTVLKEKYPTDELLPEMERDVARLQRVAERFSKIGSLPEPTSEDIVEVIDRAVEYVKRRSPAQVTYTVNYPKRPLLVRMNAPLIEWVVENLCKNAIDAMNGAGAITVTVSQNDSKAFVEIADTGKGIPKSKHKRVFEPGYTTKKRGWGLGLSLAKRIMEQYHKGRIFVKQSAPGKGTTFRMELKK
ncbi:MAG: HAMP domain-containing histidine kinase [Bacteroidaceae bacterium]|nr:HAMP domain-containing histidine kinase [Bacteroidaceae bacterium]